MRNFGFNNLGLNNEDDFETNDNDGFNMNDINTANNSNNSNSDVNFLADLLSSDNTEILLFIIVFLLLFTSFGRR